MHQRLGETREKVPRPLWVHAPLAPRELNVKTRCGLVLQRIVRLWAEGRDLLENKRRTGRTERSERPGSSNPPSFLCVHERRQAALHLQE